MIEQPFDNIKYDSYPQNDDFNDLPIEYLKRFFTKLPINCTTDSIVERLKVSWIERSIDKNI